jgi:hypothetical protein
MMASCWARSPKDGGDLCVAELPVELKHCWVRRAISEGPLVQQEDPHGAGDL